MEEIKIVQTDAISDVSTIKSIVNDLKELDSVINDMISLFEKSEGEFAKELKNQLRKERELVKSSADMFIEFASTIGIAVDRFKKKDIDAARSIKARKE